MITDFNLTIGNKQMMILLIIIPLIFVLHFYFLRHSKKRALKFGNFSAMKRVQGNTLLSKNLTPLFFLLIILLLLILSLMDITLWVMNDVSGTDYYILLDSGASMNARDISPERYGVAKSLAREITKNITGAYLGFISFGGSIQKSSPLTLNRAKILNLIDDSQITNTGTDIGLAVTSAVEGMRASNNSKIIILISDGHDTVGLPLMAGIRNAQEEHIKILTVGVGTVEGGAFLKIPESGELISKVDEENLKMISNLTTSKYINLDSINKTRQVISLITVDSKSGYSQHKLSAIFTTIVLVLIFLSWMLDNTRFRIFP